MIENKKKKIKIKKQKNHKVNRLVYHEMQKN